ncbi:acetylcholinesterase-1-like isoform X2 [Varroa destructor]|uniref:acetylcholinesterase n=1 Tax=Varroa destructor TaxID=109461 RepID=A0A7M7KF47_VARDE|nr:acetylcholinesterase-1-like isoform X2 [Varroa destructor]
MSPARRCDRMRLFFKIAVIAAARAISASEVIVKTSSGYLQGTKASVFNRTLYSFLGVPFAQPPVGDLRFAKPQPYGVWDGIYVAESLAFPCLQDDQYYTDRVQISGVNSTEDCLYLNVWTPSVCKKKACYDAQNKKPVVVILHGGGFSSGGNSYSFYNGSFLSALGDVVVVVPNYRLGVFGFLDLGTPDSPGNQAMFDQLLVLKWVRRNIASFGGDAKKVTLMGQGSGSISTGLHMVSPLSRGLFRRAIMQSGSPYVRRYESSVQTIKWLEVMARELNCSVSKKESRKKEDIAQCFKWSEGRTLLEATRRMGSGIPGSNFYPTWGNEFLPLEPREAIELGDMEPVDVLMGTNQNEGGSFIHFFLRRILEKQSVNSISPDEVHLYLNVLLRFSLHTVPKEISDYYFKGVRTSVQALQAACLAFGDFVFQCPTNYFADILSRHGRHVYMYHFDHRPSFSWWDPWLGAVHFDEFLFVMGALFHGDLAFSPSIEELRLSARMMKMWTHFIKFGEFDSSKWPEYAQYNQTYLNINPKSFHTSAPVTTYTFIGQGPVRNQACQLWKPYIKMPTSTNRPNKTVSAAQISPVQMVEPDISFEKTLASQNERLEEKIGRSTFREIVHQLRQRLHRNNQKKK